MMAGERTLPGLGLKGFWTPGSDGWNTAHDENLRLLSAVTQLRAASRTTALPGGPTNGMVYVVPANDITNPNRIAVRDNGAWVYYNATDGMIAWVVDEKQHYVYRTDSGTWRPIGGQVDFPVMVIGKPDAAETLIWYAATREIVFPANFAGSVARCSVAPLATATFSVRVNDVLIGTVVFAAGATTGSLATVDGTTKTLGAGQVLSITAPAVQDTSLYTIGITLTGRR